jgi:hypothetical protein
MKFNILFALVIISLTWFFYLTFYLSENHNKFLLYIEEQKVPKRLINDENLLLLSYSKKNKKTIEKKLQKNILKKKNLGVKILNEKDLTWKTTWKTIWKTTLTESWTNIIEKVKTNTWQVLKENIWNTILKKELNTLTWKTVLTENLVKVLEKNQKKDLDNFELKSIKPKQNEKAEKSEIIINFDKKISKAKLLWYKKVHKWYIICWWKKIKSSKKYKRCLFENKVFIYKKWEKEKEFIWSLKNSEKLFTFKIKNNLIKWENYIFKIKKWLKFLKSKKVLKNDFILNFKY